MSGATARIELRVSPEVKARIEHAASLGDTTLSGFMVAAAEAKADELMRAHQAQTLVPPDFFDALLGELDEPEAPNEAMTRAVRRSRSRAQS